MSNCVQDQVILGSAPQNVPLAWKQLNLNKAQIQEDNLDTLVNIWPSLKDHQETDLRWGDEIEYVLLRFDHDDRSVELEPQGSKVIAKLADKTNIDSIDIEREAYEYMVETSPSEPYTNHMRSLTQVEQNMKHRRMVIQKQLGASVAVFSISRFGMFGAQSSHPSSVASTPESIREKADSLITEGARYKPILDAIAARRGTKLGGEVSRYKDMRSSTTSLVSSASSDSDDSSGGDSVIVDNPIYAIGGCAVQANFGMRNAAQALRLHDQFCPIGPIMLALTAASPILKGVLVETDARWSHLKWATDDRPSTEQDLPPRWGTSNMYLEDNPAVQALNKPLCSHHEEFGRFVERLQSADMPAPLSTHYAHALCRDPMLHPKALPGTTTDGDLDDRVTRLKTHFAALWPHIRLKLPSVDGKLPWIVEFRSMETQFTDFHIAAVVVFLQLLQETIVHHNLEFRLPMDLIDENMDRAQIADAALNQNFWFNVSNSLQDVQNTSKSSDVRELSLNEIFNGFSGVDACDPGFPGLLHHVRNYFAVKAQEVELTKDEVDRISSYLDFISKRASGEEPTPAKWMRDFVLRHSDYRGDGEVSPEIYYEMMREIGALSQIW